MKILDRFLLHSKKKAEHKRTKLEATGLQPMVNEGSEDETASCRNKAGCHDSGEIETLRGSVAFLSPDHSTHSSETPSDQRKIILGWVPTPHAGRVGVQLASISPRIILIPGFFSTTECEGLRNRAT